MSSSRRPPCARWPTPTHASGSAFAFLREQGRYVEPIIRRVQKTTTDENVRILCRRLLLTDFVTDLPGGAQRG